MLVSCWLDQNGRRRPCVEFIVTFFLVAEATTIAGVITTTSTAGECVAPVAPDVLLIFATSLGGGGAYKSTSMRGMERNTRNMGETTRSSWKIGRKYAVGTAQVSLALVVYSFCGFDGYSGSAC